MKILLATGIYPPEMGGPATFVHELASALYARGDAPKIVTYGDERTRRSEAWPVCVVSRTGGAFVRYFRYAWRVYQEAKSVDVIFLQGAVSEGLPGTLAAIFARKKTVLRIPGDYAWEMYQQKGDGSKELLEEFIAHRHTGRVGLLEACERFVAQRASKVVVPSRFLERVARAWGVEASRICVIYSSVRLLPSVPSRDDIRLKLDIVKLRVVLTAVRAVPWKGVDFLLGILPQLSADTILVIAGDGPCLDVWKQQAEVLGLSERVRFLGNIPRERLAEWYVAADAFALATGYEGFPHVVVEAASVGLPCFVSDRAGNPETRELYPDYVQVLPYRDSGAWIAALRSIPPRLPSASLRAFDEVAKDFRFLLNGL